MSVLGWMVRSHGEPVLALEDEVGNQLVAVEPWSMTWDKRRGKSWHLSITVDGFRIELSVSPKGRAARLFVNGDEVAPRGRRLEAVK